MNTSFMNFSLKFCRNHRLEIWDWDSAQFLFGLDEQKKHSTLLGSFGLLVQMDKNVSGLVLLS